MIKLFCCYNKVGWLALLRLTPLSTIFQLYRGSYIVAVIMLYQVHLALIEIRARNISDDKH